MLSSMNCLGSIHCSFRNTVGVHAWSLRKQLCQMHLKCAGSDRLMCVSWARSPYCPQGSGTVVGTGVPVPCLACAGAALGLGPWPGVPKERLQVLCYASAQK